MTKGNMQIRVVSFAVVVAVVFAILAARLWYLQILTGTEYSVAAQATQTLEVKDPAQRGVIRDRDGEVLANNVPGLNVTVTPANISREKVGEMAKILGANPETALEDRKSTRLNSSHANISYAVFCLKKKTSTRGQLSSATFVLNPAIVSIVLLSRGCFLFRHLHLFLRSWHPHNFDPS